MKKHHPRTNNFARNKNKQTVRQHHKLNPHKNVQQKHPNHHRFYDKKPNKHINLQPDQPTTNLRAKINQKRPQNYSKKRGKRTFFCQPEGAGRSTEMMSDSAAMAGGYRLRRRSELRRGGVGGGTCAMDKAADLTSLHQLHFNISFRVRLVLPSHVRTNFFIFILYTHSRQCRQTPKKYYNIYLLIYK